MKKKLLLILIGGLFIFSGCGKMNQSDVIKSFEKTVNDSKSYYVSGTLEIVNNEDVYTYDVEASYKKEDNYKVNLVNTVNSHEQIILRNSDGVYVVTPSINKSFKFQSDWPYNNSQVYLLEPILKDIQSDDNKEFYETKDGYKIVVSANYPNNPKLVKEEIYFNKNIVITKVVATDSEGNNMITMKFNKIDLNSKFNDDYFDLKSVIDVEVPKEEDNKQKTDDSNTNTDESKKTKETASIEDVIYPMYLPENTYLTGKETVNKENGERLILTFEGDNPFMVIEETVAYEKEHLIVPTYGDLELMASTVAIVNDNSVNWIDNNIEYYVVSDTLSKSQLLQIANSISVLPVSK